MSRMTLIGVTGALSLPFPDFYKILDFTSAGSESSTSVAVDGDTDLEYKLICRNLSADYFRIHLNDDTTAGHYGYQFILNNAGTISAARNTDNNIGYVSALGHLDLTLLTPVGFIKTTFNERAQYTSGTTIGNYLLRGWSFNSTSNITKISFVMNSGNFTSGTRIIVYARKA